MLARLDSAVAANRPATGPYLSLREAARFVRDPAFSERQEPIVFGAFEVLPGSRSLTCRGRSIPIGGRAFDVLLTLAQAPGQVVSKDELMRRVWPSMIAEEANLRAQLRYLRRALGEERWRVKTIPGRGYLLNLARTPGGDAASPAPQESGSETRAPIMVIAAETARGDALRDIFSPTDHEQPDATTSAAWAPMRITADRLPSAAGADDGGDRFAALAACLMAALNSSRTSGVNLKTQRIAPMDPQAPANSAHEFDALVMVWRAPGAASASVALHPQPCGNPGGDGRRSGFTRASHLFTARSAAPGSIFIPITEALEKNHGPLAASNSI